MAELKPSSAVSSCLSSTAAACTPIAALEKNADSCFLTTQRSLFPCSLDDVLSVDLVSGNLLQEFSPVAVYGSVGFVSLSHVTSTTEIRPLWKQCNNLCYCDGPEYEGEVSDTYSRFHTRWLFWFASGLLYYGVVGKEASQLDFLVSTPVSYDSFSAGFDQNSRPVVAICLGEEIEIRRLQAGLYTSVTFAGTSPSLFQNGLLQYDRANQDVVCYYLRSGNLYGRWQREDFSVEYLLVADVNLNKLYATRASKLNTDPREFLFCGLDCSCRVLVSGLYPPWPVVETDRNSLDLFLLTGEHKRVTADIGTYGELTQLSFGLLSGLHRSSLITLPTIVEGAAISGELLSGLHLSNVILATTVTDKTSLLQNLTTGLHKLVVVQVGSYVDKTSLSQSLITGIHAHA